MENLRIIKDFTGSSQKRSQKAPETVDELLRRIDQLTEGATTNFYKAYSEIALVLDEKPEILGIDRNSDAYEKTKTWFERAVEINSNDPRSSANKFIRAVSKYGLLYSGKSLVNKDGKDRLADTTNIIGSNVIGYILDQKTVPNISEIINAEIDGALKQGGQDLAGWGGAFYFWDHKLKSGETIGETIKKNPEQLEKFLAINAAATRYTMGSEWDEDDYGEFFEGIWFGMNAPVPSSIQDEITWRVITKDYIGNPDRVGEWTYNEKRSQWGKPAGLRESRAVKLTPTSQEVTELSLRRQARLKHQNIDFDNIDVLGNRDNSDNVAPVNRKENLLDQFFPDNVLPGHDDFEFWSGKKSNLHQREQESINQFDSAKEKESLGLLNGLPRNSLMSSQLSKPSKFIQ
ncbi:hypothetical protein [Kiloniella sp. EL199]|uniref:hypothetical protein n=1 Tax=Kiloniella sp. EL199 TaxID=2107581 RepID=UPI000EA09238|nr:hypothetical protein [Kiloniella sp. EL199]